MVTVVESAAPVGLSTRTNTSVPSVVAAESKEVAPRLSVVVNAIVEPSILTLAPLVAVAVKVSEGTATP